MLSRRLVLKLFVALLLAFLLLGFGDSHEVLGDCTYRNCGGYHINDPFGVRRDVTTFTASKAGRLAVYWKGHDVLITLKHQGVTYPALDTSTLPIDAWLPKPLKFGLSQVVVKAGETVEMWLKDKTQPWTRGWAATGTGGAPPGWCGWSPFGKNNPAPYRDYVLSRGEPIVSSGRQQVQCWGDWDPWGELMDANDGLLIMSYDPNDNPKGFHDGDSGVSPQCRVFGWACDPDKYDQPLAVHIYEETTFRASILADIPAEPGVAAACGGNANHRFSYVFPDYGTHKIYVYAINIDSAGNPRGNNPPLTNSPREMTCPSPPVEEGDPWVRTIFGDVHTNYQIDFTTLPPGGENNADFIISARGSMANATSARNWLVRNYPKRDPNILNNSPIVLPDYDELLTRFGTGATERSTLPSSGTLQTRVYRITRSVTTRDDGTYVVPGNVNALIFIDGDPRIGDPGNLRLRDEFAVPRTSTVVFIVRGNINFDIFEGTGGPEEDYAGGYYIAGGNINTLTGSTGLTKIKKGGHRLVVDGLVSLRGFVRLNRDLPAETINGKEYSNRTKPAEEIRLLPTYRIFPTKFSGRPSIYWREVEPLPLP